MFFKLLHRGFVAAVRRASGAQHCKQTVLRGKLGACFGRGGTFSVPPLRTHVPYCDILRYDAVGSCIAGPSTSSSLCAIAANFRRRSLLQWATRMWHQGSRDIALQRLRVDALRWRVLRGALLVPSLERWKEFRVGARSLSSLCIATLRLCWNLAPKRAELDSSRGHEAGGLRVGSTLVHVRSICGEARKPWTH